MVEKERSKDIGNYYCDDSHHVSKYLYFRYSVNQFIEERFIVTLMCNQEYLEVYDNSQYGYIHLFQEFSKQHFDFLLN